MRLRGRRVMLGSASGLSWQAVTLVMVTLRRHFPT
jgi:hypothetical protein